ncbi:MAG: AMP-binding protein [Nitrosomonadales bacterium]|nr:AMP-binding protein [Nitrosomonadales bacterium]
MIKLPLITHPSLAHTVAWRQGEAISAEKFLGDVVQLAAMLPAGRYMLNICRDRYHFAVGLAAAIVSGKVSLLPPTHTPEMVNQLKSGYPDVFCLHDNEHCETALPRLCYPDFSPQHPVSIAVPQIDSQQLVAIVFTSGSTGSPLPHGKSWGSLVQNVQAQAALLGLLPENEYSIVGTVPPQHMYGLESTLLLAWQSANAFSHAQPFYPADICDAVAAVKAPRILVSTPLHLRLLLESELELPSLDLVLSATAPLSAQLANKSESTFAAPLKEIYGSTETGQIAMRRPTQSLHWKLFPEVQLTALVDGVWASGGHVESATMLNDVIEVVTEDRFLLHGRLQDLINIAGKRSSLANLDYHLNSIPGVLDGAFFMPDETSHDHVTRLCACVVAPDMTSRSVMTALRQRVDPVFLPRPLLFFDELPRNSTGKLPREALRKLIETHSNELTLNSPA